MLAEREHGIVPTWGTKTALVFKDKNGNQIISPNKVAAGVIDEDNVTQNESSMNLNSQLHAAAGGISSGRGPPSPTRGMKK